MSSWTTFPVCRGCIWPTAASYCISFCLDPIRLWAAEGLTSLSRTMEHLPIHVSWISRRIAGSCGLRPSWCSSGSFDPGRAGRLLNPGAKGQKRPDSGGVCESSRAKHLVSRQTAALDLPRPCRGKASYTVHRKRLQYLSSSCAALDHRGPLKLLVKFRGPA